MTPHLKSSRVSRLWPMCIMTLVFQSAMFVSVMRKVFIAFGRRKASGSLVKRAFENIADSKVSADSLNAESSIIVKGLFTSDIPLRFEGKLPAGILVMKLF